MDGGSGDGYFFSRPGVENSNSNVFIICARNANYVCNANENALKGSVMQKEKHALERVKKCKQKFKNKLRCQSQGEVLK